MLVTGPYLRDSPASCNNEWAVIRDVIASDGIDDE